MQSFTINDLQRIYGSWPEAVMYRRIPFPHTIIALVLSY